MVSRGRTVQRAIVGWCRGVGLYNVQSLGGVLYNVIWGSGDQGVVLYKAGVSGAQRIVL